MNSSQMVGKIDPPGTVLLTTHGLSKDYSTRVLDNIDLEIHRGEIHALLGANGAGKSTLCKIIAGLVAPTTGTLLFQGEPFHPQRKSDAESSGVQIVQQELNLIPTLTIAENLFFTKLPAKFGWINRSKLRLDAKKLLDDFGLQDLDLDAKVRTLGVGQQQMLEIAGNLSRDCKLLILDEPTAALTVREAEHLFQKLRSAKEQGVGIIYISHRLDEVIELCDRCTVLRDGKRIGTFETKTLTRDAMVELMTPVTNAQKSKSQLAQNKTESLGDTAQASNSVSVALSIKNVSRSPYVRNVSFEVSHGEVLGIAGLVGSGRTELLRLIFGADRADEGTMRLGDRDYAKLFRNPAEAVANGIAMITEDRKANGLLLTQSIVDNIVLASLRGKSSAKYPGEPSTNRVSNRIGIYSANRSNEIAKRFIQRLDIRQSGLKQHAAKLSGGNQQKLVLAKWLNLGAGIFLFDEPTRGIDVAARRLVHEVIEQLRRDGKAIIIVSSDLDELLETSTRIGVLSNGQWIKEFRRSDFDKETITSAMFEGYRAANDSKN